MSLPAESVCVLPPVTTSTLGLVAAAVPIRGSAWETADCMANKPANSDAVIHLWLYMVHPSKALGSSFLLQFRSVPVCQTGAVDVARKIGEHCIRMHG